VEDRFYDVSKSTLIIGRSSPDLSELLPVLAKIQTAAAAAVVVGNWRRGNGNGCDGNYRRWSESATDCAAAEDMPALLEALR